MFEEQHGAALVGDEHGVVLIEEGRRVHQAALDDVALGGDAPVDDVHKEIVELAAHVITRRGGRLEIVAQFVDKIPVELHYPGAHRGVAAKHEHDEPGRPVLVYGGDGAVEGVYLVGGKDVRLSVECLRTEIAVLF